MNAFERAREMIGLNLTNVHQSIRDMMEADVYRIGDDLEKPDEASADWSAEVAVDKNRVAAAGPAVAEPVVAAVTAEQPATGSPPLPVMPPSLRAGRPLASPPTASSSGRLDVETVRLEPREGEHDSVGDVAIVVPEDAEALWVRQLRQRMLGTPGVQILSESGGDGDALTLYVHLDEPMELLSVLQRMPNVRGVIKSQHGRPEGDSAESAPGENAPQTVLTIVLR